MENEKLGMIQLEKQEPVLSMGIPRMLLIVFLCSLLTLLVSYIGENLNEKIHSAVYVMIYLTGVVSVSCHSSRKIALGSSLLSVLSYDFLCVEPRFTFIPDDRQYFIVVLFMFLVAIIVNELAYRALAYAHKANVLEGVAEREKLKNTLLRSVSHDFKSPLTAIMGASSLLAGKTDTNLSPDQKIELASSIEKESSRLNSIVSNLLDMTRLESGGIVLQKDWYHFDELLANSISSIETRYGAQDFDIKLDENMPLLNIDPLLIEQLIVNIIENSIKYAADSRYTISASRDGSDLLISFENSGEPLNDGELKKLFDKFYQGNRLNSVGLGLGLSICRSIVELHDGKIWFESGRSDGVKLNIHLPIPEDTPEIELDDELTELES